MTNFVYGTQHCLYCKSDMRQVPSVSPYHEDFKCAQCGAHYHKSGGHVDWMRGWEKEVKKCMYCNARTWHGLADCIYCRDFRNKLFQSQEEGRPNPCGEIPLSRQDLKWAESSANGCQSFPQS